MTMQPTERANFWRLPHFGDMELLRATYVTHRFPLHFHEEYVVGIIERNGYEFHYEGSKQQIKHGEIVLINPGEIHSGYPTDDAGWSYRTFYPGITLMRQIAREITGTEWTTPFFNSPVLRDAQLAGQLRVLHRAMEHHAPRLMQDILLRDALALLISRYAHDRKNPLYISGDNRAVVQAREYLHAHFAEDVALEDIAKAVALSPYHLSRLFKRHTGLPPHKYLIQIRLHRAKTLLASGMPIADVAVSVGFADQSHLTKWFKRVHGVPPGQFTIGTNE
ncbi:MAG: AraC family transcriptional regulator [Chloroflexota bacterium]